MNMHKKDENLYTSDEHVYKNQESIHLPPLPKWMTKFSIPEDVGVWGEGHQWLNERMKAYAIEAVKAERQRCINIVESYQIPTGNSPAGEIASDITYSALKEIRDNISGESDE